MTNHIRSLHNAHLTYCDKNITPGLLVKNIDQAIVNGQHNMGLQMCVACTTELMHMLYTGIVDELNHGDREKT